MSGSSPLARGTSAAPLHDYGGGRLIPARAGNISLTALSSATSPAHPRSRGEHHFLCDVHHVENGSSPLARGTSQKLRSRVLLRRLIPARAGNITRGACALEGNSAHPRSRGEHSEPQTQPLIMRGSSPLARGTSAPPKNQKKRIRLIPARAGNMTCTRNPVIKSSAHPRSRGEH